MKKFSARITIIKPDNSRFHSPKIQFIFQNVNILFQKMFLKIGKKKVIFSLEFFLNTP